MVEGGRPGQHRLLRRLGPADSLLRWHFVKAGRIQRADRLSVRFAWMAAKETDQFDSAPTTFIEIAGTSLKSALDVARKFGAVHESVLPFDSGKLYGGEERASTRSPPR